MAHPEPLLRRTEPRHPDAATFPGLRRLEVVDRRSEGPDLDALAGHACIIRIRPPSRIVPRFPVITGQTGQDPIFQGAADFDLELIDSRTLDGNIQDLIYRPTPHI